MSTCPIPCLESSPTPSHMLKPNASKTQFSKQKLFVLENILPSFGKYIGLPSEANCWIIFPNIHGFTSEMNCWTTLQGNSSENLLEIPFTTIFIFLSFSFMSCTHTYHVGCPGAYEMHYVISKQFILIYLHAYINISYVEELVFPHLLYVLFQLRRRSSCLSLF